MKKFRQTKLPKFRLGAENFVRRKILSAENLSDKVCSTVIFILSLSLLYASSGVHFLLFKPASLACSITLALSEDRFVVMSRETLTDVTRSLTLDLFKLYKTAGHLFILTYLQWRMELIRNQKYQRV